MLADGQIRTVSLRRKQLHIHGADFCVDRDRLVNIAYCIDVGARLERSVAVFELHGLALESPLRNISDLNSEDPPSGLLIAVTLEPDGLRYVTDVLGYGSG